ncbi:MAG: hypothetical protein ACRC0M_08955 [Legionella sp.]
MNQILGALTKYNSTIRINKEDVMTLIKKITYSILISTLFATTAFAGSEDWDGKLTFKSAQGDLYTITHTPKRVQFLFFSAGECIALSKGSSINGMIIPEDVKLCKASNVDSFTSEVQKLGIITNKTITLGPTYTP